jgi:hypothetical protein
MNGSVGTGATPVQRSRAQQQVLANYVRPTTRDVRPPFIFLIAAITISNIGRA